MSSNDSNKNVEKLNEQVLRNYSKVIFFYPLFFVSLTFWIIEFSLGTNVSWLGTVWLIIFFSNLFVIAFDIPSTKFFIIILAIVAFVILFIFLILPNLDSASLDVVNAIESTIRMSATFYLAITMILGIIFLIAVISAHLDFWVIERNEIYHKKGIFESAERFPVKSLRIVKRIPDVFEFFLLRAGSITLLISKTEIHHLNTIVNVSKKADNIDYLLSHMEVEIDDLDA